MTTTRRVPKYAAGNSTDPTSEGATMLPATRTTNRSPNPWSNSISTGVLESEQPRTTAKGRCASVASCALHGRAEDVPDPSGKRRLPSINRCSDSSGDGELGSQVRGIGRHIAPFASFRAGSELPLTFDQRTESGASGAEASRTRPAEQSIRRRSPVHAEPDLRLDARQKYEAEPIAFAGSRTNKWPSGPCWSRFEDPCAPHWRVKRQRGIEIGASRTTGPTGGQCLSRFDGAR
jgi:hypothetical protein